jgi:quinol monooxygenase YgiN
MKVSSRKRKELSQAITSLLNSVRKKRGCVRCDFFHGMENENIFCLLQEWDSMKNFETYRESECHKVLQGAAHLLYEPCVIILYQRLQPAGKLQLNGLEIQQEN